MTTVLDVQRYKDEGRRFAMLTCYDFTTARLLDAAEIPVLLVGDSLGMTMLGHDTTVPVAVTLSERSDNGSMGGVFANRSSLLPKALIQMKIGGE